MTDIEKLIEEMHHPKFTFAGGLETGPLISKKDAIAIIRKHTQGKVLVSVEIIENIGLEAQREKLDAFEGGYVEAMATVYKALSANEDK